jgi:phospholipase C
MPEILHFFVLMLENRSFDHMLGFMPKVDGLNGEEANWHDGTIQKPGSPHAVVVSNDAFDTMKIDPHHEFDDVRVQLMGRAPNDALRKYGCDDITMAGFVQALGAGAIPPRDPALAMRCFDPRKVRVLSQLASEFAVCDDWFSSVPGSTWPNRFFVHAATSGGLFDGPSKSQMAAPFEDPFKFYWEGYKFQQESIFDQLGHNAKIYSGSYFPHALSLANVRYDHIGGLQALFRDIAAPGFSKQYVFIEPAYGRIMTGSFRGGSSQHPLDSVRSGELLIKRVYEALRRSPIWERSALIITYDEHGGFYDHVVPPCCEPPGDADLYEHHNIDTGVPRSFDFAQLGVRVPAVIVSPLIPRGMVDPTHYDHTSILATVHRCFGGNPLTKRDAAANCFDGVFQLPEPRRDTPERLVDPAPAEASKRPPRPERLTPLSVIQNAFLDVAKRAAVQLTPPFEWNRLLARWENIRTVYDADQYLREVEAQVR